MSTAHVLIGIPASGKSTLARQMADGVDCFRVNKDDIRSMMTGDSSYIQANESLFVRVQYDIIDTILRKDKDVVVDNTNCNYDTLVHLLQRVSTFQTRAPLDTSKVNVVLHVFMTDYKVCIERNALRQNKARVPENVLVSMQDKLTHMTASGKIEALTQKFYFIKDIEYHQ